MTKWASRKWQYFHNLQIADGKSYQFTNVNMGHYKKEHGLRTTEMIKITSIKDLDLNIYEHDVTPNTVFFDGKFTSVQLGRLIIVYQCPKCYSKDENRPVKMRWPSLKDIKDEMAIWDHCLRVSAEDQCSSKCEVGCTVMDTDAKVKYNVVVPHNILKEVVPVLLEEQITFVKLLLKGTYTQSNAIITFSRATKWLYHQMGLN